MRRGVAACAARLRTTSRRGFATGRTRCSRSTSNAGTRSASARREIAPAGRMRCAAPSPPGAVAPALRAELEALLNPLAIADALHVVRAFSYFSHLANIAEDVHQNRRRRAHALAGSPPQRGSIAHALEHLAAAGIDKERLLHWLG